MLVFVQSRFLDTWELIHDDSNTLFAANRFLHEWYWLGPKTSVGIPHFPFVYLLWSLFLRISYTTRAVQWGILLLLGAGHYVLIGAAHRFFPKWASYAVSALAFTCAPVFVFYSQKFWEPAVLPVCTTAAFALLLTARERKNRRWLGALAFSFLFAAGGHLNAMLLAAAAAVVLVAGRARFPLRAAGRLVLAGVSAELMYFLLAAPAADPIRRLLDLVDPFQNALARHVGAPGPPASWFHLASVLLFLFFARAGANLDREDPLRRQLFFWLTLPLLALGGEAVALQRFEWHWPFFLLPAAWLAVADSALWLGSRCADRRARAAVAAVLLGGLISAHAIEAGRTERYVIESGGTADHFANLDVKEAVVERTAAGGTNFAFFNMTIPYGWNHYDNSAAWSWLLLVRFGERPVEAKRRFYYAQELGTPGAVPDLLGTLRSVPGVREERIGSVALFEARHPVDGGGVEVH
jgi:hypothetical protein